MKNIVTRMGFYNAGAMELDEAFYHISRIK